MRGLQNMNIAYFPSDNCFGFPDVLPITKQVKADINDIYDFEYARKYKYHCQALHFYIDDFKFENVWTDPAKYISAFQKPEYIIMPDFSLYYDFPRCLQMYNKYRNHWLANYYTLYGINVIPNISISTPNDYDWSLLGYPKRSVVAFSSVGSNRNRLDKYILKKSYDTMLRILDPLQVLYFTRSVNSAPSECTVIPIKYLRGGER